jgi:hypothetical protein
LGLSPNDYLVKPQDVAQQGAAMNAMCREELNRGTGSRNDLLPQTISFTSMTMEVEIGKERQDGHRHNGCPFCSEEAVPERCPGYRIEWL